MMTVPNFLLPECEVTVDGETFEPSVHVLGHKVPLVFLVDSTVFYTRDNFYQILVDEHGQEVSDYIKERLDDRLKFKQ